MADKVVAFYEIHLTIFNRDEPMSFMRLIGDSQIFLVASDYCYAEDDTTLTFTAITYRNGDIIDTSQKVKGAALSQTFQRLNPDVDDP